MVSLPNEERSEESSYLCVVVFSNGKLRGPVLTLTSSQGLQQAFCCPVSSFYMKDGRDGLTSHLATSPCHLNVQFFCISLLLQKQVWTWGMYVCVRKRDRFESSPDAPEGICWVPIEGDYTQMELSGRLELLKDFVKMGQWAGSFPSKALSFLFSSCIWLCKAEYSPPAHSSFLNQNQKVIKNWKLMWETFIFILKPGTRFWEWWFEHWFLIFLFRAVGWFLGKCPF